MSARLAQSRPPSPAAINPLVLQEALDADLLVFSPYPSLSMFLRDSHLADCPSVTEVAW